ncbi:amidohydrolase family protein [Methylocella sp. CPCC 101449]|uniref:amidohydrolase family protein n=1 Tax=Methylocella sp. CPCC 101449 TaxID=2987531 RepID=UPI00288E7599|nr:amidohydrolase family protein [Methylocella sp. CPCC 101449]MDT2020798.1 amidohydrolase family protein [Methylocella sp. CPCC 101449]
MAKARHSFQLAIVLTLAGTGLAQAQGADGYFKGKTLTIAVGGTAGGGIDIGARMLAQYIGKYYPGEPRDAGLRVSLAPPIEMTMGHGMPGIQGALDHGIRPSLSSDVDATMAQDPFTIMRTTLTLQRALVLQRERQGEKNLPPLLTARDVLEFATIEGARCAHLDHKTGSLTPGKQADLILLRTDSLSAWPINNAVGAVVNVMNPSHVDTVMIDGKMKKWRGHMVGVDTARVLRLAEEARAGVLQRCGFKRDLLE